jgi:hypothetical protein
VLDTVYVEINSTQNPAILFGDVDGTRARGLLHGVTIRDCYFNLHNLDSKGTSHVMGPASPAAGLRSSRFLGNTVNSLRAGEPLIVQNDVPGQQDNAATNNFLIGSRDDWVPARGASLSGARWGPQDETTAPPR